MDLRAGDIFAGHRIESVAGRGGMGVVYRATQLDLDRPVALKLIAPELSQDEGFRERFVRESRIAAAIDHPHVIPIYYAGEEDGQLYLAMRYVDGEDLRAIVRREGMLEPHRAARIVSQIGGALDAAHARGLVHRDVKPANVLLTHDDHAYLTDFGLSKRVFDTSAQTRTGQWVGTLGYVAPEQIRGQRVDARTDVFALGCVLFFALSAATPFQRESDEATLWAHLNDPPEPVDVLAPGVPLAFLEVLDRALAKDPDDRFQSTGDLGRAALRAAGETVSSEPERLVARGAAAPGAEEETIITGATPPTGERSATAMTTLGDDAIRRRRRRLGVLGLLAVAAVAAATIAIVVLGSSGSSSPTTRATTPPTTTRTTPSVPTTRSVPTTPANPGVQVDKTLHTGLRLNSIAIMAPTVWASGNQTRRLVSFHQDDATRATPVAKIAGTAAIAATPGSLWLLNVRNGSLSRMRQGSMKVRVEIPSLAPAGQPIVLHTGDGSVWTGLLKGGHDQIQRIDFDRTSAKIVGTIEVGSGLIDFGIGSGTLWILDQRNVLQGIRLNNGHSVHEQITDDPQHVAVGEGAVYITRAASATLLKVNPYTLKKTVLGTTGAFPTALAVHGTDVWVLGQNDGTVSHFDRDGGRIGDPMPVCPEPYAVAADANGAWIACVNGWVVRVSS